MNQFFFTKFILNNIIFNIIKISFFFANYNYNLKIKIKYINKFINYL